MSKIPTSLFGRGTKLIGLATRLAVDEVKGRMASFEDEKEKLKNRVKQAQDLVSTLSQLKGASMKVGQLLSLDLGEYLPPEIVKVLEDLHSKATFLPYNEIEKILKEELKDRFKDFSSIAQTPIAAASIGQVHLARLKDKDVVIKIQYPGIAEAIPSDLRLLEILMKQGGVIFRKSETDIGPFLDEVKEVLMKEADYHHEASMLQNYRMKFAGSSYVIPEVFTDYSTGKILTMEYIRGRSLSEWLETGPSEDEREKLADLLIRLYLEEVFTHRMVQTDPNPGNFLITFSGELALLDFGASKVYSKEFVESYRKILLAADKKDFETVISESTKIGFLDEREDQIVRDIYIEMMDFLAEPFRKDHAFDFTDKTFFTKSRDLSWEMTKKCRYTPPPKDLLFLHRKLAGVFLFIRKLDVKIRLRDYWAYVEGSSVPKE